MAGGVCRRKSHALHDPSRRTLGSAHRFFSDEPAGMSAGANGPRGLRSCVHVAAGLASRDLSRSWLAMQIQSSFSDGRRDPLLEIGRSADPFLDGRLLKRDAAPQVTADRRTPGLVLRWRRRSLSTLECARGPQCLHLAPSIGNSTFSSVSTSPLASEGAIPASARARPRKSLNSSLCRDAESLAASA